MKKTVKKLSSLVLAFALITSLIPTTDAKAASAASFQETENNDTAQTANAFTISEGKTTITGSTQHDDSKETKKDEYDWYKITFANQGKCDFKVISLTDASCSDYIYSYYFDVLDDDFNEYDSFRYGLAHDADDTFYLRVKASVETDSDTGYYNEYQIILDDDSSVEYVSGNHTTTSTAYMLTEGQAAFTLGWNDKHTRYFSIKVPSGKKAEVTIEPTADADMNEILKSPYQLSIVRQSDNEQLLRNYELKKAATFTCVTNSDETRKVYLSGKDTYFIGIDGGSYPPNCQWVSVKYRLTDNKSADTTKPTVSGVKNGKTYKKSVKITYKDTYSIKSAKINGKRFKSGKIVSKNGSYTVTVTDKAGNTRTVRFKIKK